MKRTDLIPPRSGLTLLEEGTQLLREAPAATFVCYYLGTIPFVLFALFFLADMGRSADAADRVASASGWMTLLYFWMRAWQSIFCAKLFSQLEGLPEERIGLVRFGRILSRQMGWQALSLITVPLASLVVVPFGWVFAFHQNVGILAAKIESHPRLGKEALQQALRWPAQNHSLLLLFGVVILFAALNVTSGLLSLPTLLKMTLGIDLVAARNALSLLNTTTLGVILAGTYLICDPLLKASYLLRCFYGTAETSAADLRAAFRKWPAKAAMAAVLVFLLSGYASRGAEPLTTPTASSPIASEEMDQALEKVIGQREYSWRLPREKEVSKSEASGFWDDLQKKLESWMAGVGQTIKRGAKAVFEGLIRFINWIYSKLPGKKLGTTPGPWGLEAPPGWVIATVLFLIALGAGIYIYFKKFRGAVLPAAPLQPVIAPPDLTDENITADQLSEDNWLKLAATMAEQGDYRLALRALYLASLSHLSRREIIRITKSKSNHDYWREVQRKGKTVAGLPEAFGENLGIFERIWYGMYEVNRDIYQQFQGNVQRIQSC